MFAKRGLAVELNHVGICVVALEADRAFHLHRFPAIFSHHEPELSVDHVFVEPCSMNRDGQLVDLHHVTVSGGHITQQPGINVPWVRDAIIYENNFLVLCIIDINSVILGVLLGRDGYTHT